MLDNGVKTKEFNCKQIQERALLVLDAFNEYAQKNKLEYYMAGGTLLGAVRHKGFIPWDDDIDIMMPRHDYNRLCKTFSNDRYKLICIGNNKKYGNPFARIWDTKTVLKWDNSIEPEIGAFIDIFPIDGFPSNSLASRLHQVHLKYLRIKLSSSQRVLVAESEKFGLVKKVLPLVFRKSPNHYAQKLEKLAMRYSYEKCKYVGVKVTIAHLFKERNSKSIFKETVFMPFENMLLPAPCGYEVYLEHLYGNYMELPPVEDQISVHPFKIYARDL